MVATKNPLVRLHHIRDEIEAITAVLRGISRDRFLDDYLLQRGAEHALLVISEAAKSLPGDLRRRYPDVDWSSVIGLGNILRHEYHMIDLDTLWVILTSDLPALALVVDRIIRDVSS